MDDIGQAVLEATRPHIELYRSALAVADGDTNRRGWSVIDEPLESVAQTIGACFDLGLDGREPALDADRRVAEFR